MSETTFVTDYTGPEGLRTRGTVLVVPGRGESEATYRRFGRRLAADSYRVRLLCAAAVAALVARSVPQPGTPDVPWWPQALVLAALPGYAAHQPGSWDDELNVRTQCSVHRAVLSDDESVRRGALSAAVPGALLDAAYGSTADVPQLMLVGDADPLADRDALARAAKALPAARLVVVRRAHHDVLNDLQHRSVAAEVVMFLEALRNEPPLEPIVEVESIDILPRLKARDSSYYPDGSSS